MARRFGVECSGMKGRNIRMDKGKWVCARGRETKSYI